MKNVFFTNFKLSFILLTTLLFLQIELVNTSCTNGVAITDTSCFNNLIIIQNYYRAGQFATDKNGNMFIEYSNDEDGKSEYRLFYGLKKDGRNYFANDNAHKIIQIETSESNKGRYESRILFVSLEDDIEKNKQYLFSASAYNTLTELHDIEEGTYVVKGANSFWKIIGLFSFQYSLMELKKDNKIIYFCAFTQHETDQILVNGKWEDYSKTFSIKKFSSWMAITANCPSHNCLCV